LREIFFLLSIHLIPGVLAVFEAVALPTIERLFDGGRPGEELEIDFIRSICQDVPFIAIDVDLGPRLPIVMVDQDRGARLAIEHVTDLGHRQIAFICGPSQWRAAKLRTRGWMKALERANLAPGPMLEGDWSAKSGYFAALELLRDHRNDFHRAGNCE
jgi:DNA-binding LacI/PurR family transcriptional regulator